MKQFNGSLVNDEEKEQASEVTAVKPDFNFKAKFILTILNITNTGVSLGIKIHSPDPDRPQVLGGHFMNY